MTTSSANLKAMSFDKLSKLRDQVDAILNAKVAEERRAMQSRLNELDRLGVNGDACQGRRPWLSRRRCSKIFQSRKPRGDLGRAGAEATLARREARVRQEARGFPHWGAGKESAGEVQEGASRREGLSDLGMSAWLPLSTIGSPTRFRPVAERRKRRKAVPPFVGGTTVMAPGAKPSPHALTYAMSRRSSVRGHRDQSGGRNALPIRRCAASCPVDSQPRSGSHRGCRRRNDRR